MAQAKQPGRDKSLASLHKATDTLSTMLAQEVKELNARQKAQRADGSDPALMKGLKEATAVLKDLAAVAKTLNDQGADCLLYTSPSPRDGATSRMPSSA